MSKTYERMDGSRTPVQGTLTKRRRGWPTAWGRITGVLVVAACASWGMDMGGVARGQGLNPEYNEWRGSRASSVFQEKFAPKVDFEKAEKKAKQAAKKSQRDGSGETGPTPIPAGNGETGLIPSVMDYSYLGRINFLHRTSYLGEALPSAFDARSKGWVTSVKQQRPFGTCWAHAAIGNIEGVLRQKYPDAYSSDKMPDLSENNMVLQSGYFEAGTDLYNSGGTFDMAMAYLSRWDGPIAEEDDVYPLSAYSDSYFSNVHKAPVFHVQQSVMYEPKSSDLDHDAIKRAIMQYGGVWVTYAHYSGVEGIPLDESGILYTLPFISESGHAFYNWYGKITANHAVLLVGWDDEFSRTNFVFETEPAGYLTPTPPGDGAYLIKNSWGPDEFDNGYLWFSYYDKSMLHDRSYAVTKVDGPDNYAQIYQYDTLGNVYPVPNDSYTWGANMFTAGEDGEIAAVGFYVLAPETRYRVYVYADCEPGKPTSGQCLNPDGDGALASYGGYLTVPLSTPIPIKKGKLFSVVVRFESNADLEAIGLESLLASEVNLVAQNYTYLSWSDTPEATSGVGQSWVSVDGDQWTDLTRTKAETVEAGVRVGYYYDDNGNMIYVYDDIIYLPESANLCIKAYTKNATAEKPVLTGVAIHAVDGTTVASGKTGRFRCDATYSDNSTKEGVAAKWSMVAGDEWASIDDTGVLQAEEVVENHTVTIRAVYEEDGVRKEKDGDVQITAGAPGIPQGVEATSTEREVVRVTWSKSDGAAVYAVYRTEGGDNPNGAKFLGETTDTKYPDTTASPGKYYWYYVKAKNGSGQNTKSSAFSKGAKGVRLLASPSDVKASTEYTDRIDVSWSASEGATHYRVARAEARGGEREVLGEWQEERRFIDRPPKTDKSYYYYVAAAVDASGSMAAEGEIPAEGMKPSAAIPTLEVRGPESLESGKGGDYEAYVTWTKGKEEEGPLEAKWEVSAGSVSVSGTKARVTAPKVSASGKITVSATHERTGLLGHKEVIVTAGGLGQVTGLRVTSATADGIGLGWNAVDGASGYIVARTGGNGGAATFKSTATSYTDTSAEVGVKYEYTVAAENAAGKGPASEPVDAFIGLSAPGGVTATSDRTDCVRVKWSATAGATHFRVGRATSESGSKTTLGNGWTTDRMFDDEPPRDNTKYWYFVKAATDASGSHASGWSAGVQGMKLAEKTLEGLAISGPDRVGSGEVAVYSCVAEWSDGESGTVAAEWTATRGSIGGDGKWEAPSVSADATAKIVARYGGMAVTQEVTVVGTSVEATAEVTDVKAAQRWPFEGLVDIDYTLVTSPSGTKAVIAVSGRDEDHGTTLAATTLEGYGAGGAAVSPGDLRVTWDIGTDYPGLNAASVRVDVTAAVAAKESLPAPVVTVKNATTTNGWALAVSWTLSYGAASYEVWRGTSGSLDTAALMTTTTGTNWVDTGVTVHTTYTYWVAAKKDQRVGWSEGVQGTPEMDLMPLRSLLTGIDAIRIPDGIISETEMNKAMSNSTIADMDGDPTTISDSEWEILLWIQRLNNDAELIANVIRGEYSGISSDMLLELFTLSQKVRILMDWAPNVVTASQGDGSTAQVSVSWSRMNAISYEVYRSATMDGRPTLVATVTATNWADTNVVYRQPYWYRVKAVYDTETSGFSGKAKGYWGDWCHDNKDLMPLRSLLTSIDAVKNLDGVLSETEMNRVMSNSTIIDMDGDPTKISDAEMSIFQRIKTLNQDPALITALIQGDYTYAGMSEAEFLECYSISEAIRALTKY